jgi:lipid-A-disaccharide synthase
MKYYIIAGEASGDLHGSNLIKALHKQGATADIRCWGGDKMEQAGATLVKHYRDLAFMGFIEVLMNLRTILKNLSWCKKDILSYQPDVLILIDYPGFNLRIAEWAKQQHIKVVYYISPQVWAWKENRVKMMKQCIDKMLVILPFEQEYFQSKWNWQVEYVGHPLLEEVQHFLSRQPATPFAEKPIIALLPGSRKQELLKKLPIMLEVSRSFPNYQFIVAKAPAVPDVFYDTLLKNYTNVSSVSNQTYALLQQSTAALVTSGTATLETALFEVPQVVCYKGNPVSYHIAKRLVRIPFISLVNLISGKEVVKELIQNDLTPANLRDELAKLLPGSPGREAMIESYRQLKQQLAAGGHASAAAASQILRVAEEAQAKN